MSENHGIDLVGIGTLAKAVPAKAWNEMVSTACSTFKQCVAPIAATTAGIGRLIEVKFDKMVETEKILAAKCLTDATQKLEQAGKRSSGKQKSKVIVAAIEESASQSEEAIHQLWSNLLAQELIDGSVHPEIPKILARLSTEDAVLLAQIAEADKEKLPIKLLKAFTTSLPVVGLLSKGIQEKTTFSHKHLSNLGLVEKVEGLWLLTIVGREFIRCVSSPEANTLS
jgi:hypothetical protein